MSVINQMLRDLDARGQGDASRRAALASVGQASASRAPAWRSQRLWWLVAALTLALASTVVMLMADRRESVEDAPPPSRSPSPRADAPPVPSPVALPPDSVSSPSVVDVAPADEAPPPVAPSPVALPAPEKPLAAPSERAVAPPPSPVRASVPVARTTIERVAPAADPLDEARRALSEGRTDAALAALAAVDEREPPTAERDALEAAALQALGRHAEAELAYRRALRREPDIGAWWAGLGISLEANGQGREALAAYREAQRRGPLAPALADYLGERVDALSASEPPR